MSNDRRIANIDEHKVSTGETLSSIASAKGMTWQELTAFNWGSNDPHTINERLRHDVGCRQTRPGSQTYVFDDHDDPGVIFVPAEWMRSGLATDQTHTIRVRRLDFDPAETTIRLFGYDGNALAGARYAVLVNGNEVRRGCADQDGDITIPDTLAKICTVKWARPESMRANAQTSDEHHTHAATGEIDPEFEFAREIYLEFDEAPTDSQPQVDAAQRRLSNMGYYRGHSLADNVRAFQRDAEQPMTGEIDDAHPHVRDCHDEKCQPPGDRSGAGKSA